MRITSGVWTVVPLSVKKKVVLQCSIRRERENRDQIFRDSRKAGRWDNIQPSTCGESSAALNSAIRSHRVLCSCRIKNLALINRLSIAWVGAKNNLSVKGGCEIACTVGGCRYCRRDIE